ncbi:MAG: efflux RND transporter permease subunit [Hyphomicrobiaceae bacterium]
MAFHANDLPGMSVRRPYLAAVLNLLIIVAGISAILGVEVRELPDIDRPVVSVRANYPGGTPESVDAEITSVVESAVARVNGIKTVRSSSEEDNFRIHIVFAPNIDLVDAANDVREAVSRAARQLPDGVEQLTVVKADADANPILRLAVASTQFPIEDLSRIVEDKIIPKLIAIDGVADITTFGDRKRVMRVQIDPLRLASYRLAVADVAKVLQKAHTDVPAGSFKSDEQAVLVRADASARTPAAIKKLIISGDVRIGDVADVFFAPKEKVSLVRLNGREVINLGIIRQAKSNTVEIATAVKAVAAGLNQRLDGITLTVTSDDSLFVKGAIREVLISLALAIFIVVGVISIFIGQVRTALIPAVAIPVALIGTVAAIWLLGFSINLVTLLALVLAAGLVVDDSIVVLENVQRLRSEGVEPQAAAVIGTRQVFFAVVATTATLICVFLPISFLPSDAGRLFREFGFVLAVTVAISSFVALTLVPMLAARLQGAGGGLLKFKFLDRIGNGLQRAYAAILDRVLSAPLVFIAICCLAIVGAAITYPKLGEELLPSEDRGRLTVWLVGPDGVGLRYTDRQVERVEKVMQPLIDDGVVKDLFTIAGRYDINRGYILAPLVPWSERTVTQQQLQAKLRPQLNKIPGARARSYGGNSLGLRGAGRGIRFALTGSDYDMLAVQARKLVERLEKDAPEVRNFRVEFRATQPQLAVVIDRRKASDLGVTINDLSATLRALVDRTEVGEITVGDRNIPIMLSATAGSVTSPSDLRSLYVRGADDTMVSLAHLISFSERGVPAELDRHGQSRAVEIFADQAEGYSLRDGVRGIERVAKQTLPPEVGLLFLRQAATLNETSNDLQITFIIATIIVFMVLVAQFESLMSATVVLLTVPFGVCAAIFALAMTGTTINIYSQIGVLMLIGIMAKNSILMVEFADQLRDNGQDVPTATRNAATLRVRPIVMTMVSTVLAGLPLIFGGGPGAEARASIGWVVFGGLGMAAVFTLFLTPAVYVLLARFVRPRSNAEQQLDREMRGAEAVLGNGRQPAE